MKASLLVAALVVVGLVGCTKKESAPAAGGGEQKAAAPAASAKGIGPVTDLKIEGFSAELAGKGKAAFDAKCAACHKIEERYVGPALKGVTQRRAPEWIMNMIMNPVEMTQKDPQAQALLAEFLTQMTFQNVSQDETRAILEYFRQNDGAK